MMPMRMPGISSLSRVTVLLTLRRTCVRHGYMLPVVSKLKTTSMRVSDMRWPPFSEDYRTLFGDCNRLAVSAPAADHSCGDRNDSRHDDSPFAPGVFVSYNPSNGVRPLMILSSGRQAARN